MGHSCWWPGKYRVVEAIVLAWEKRGRNYRDGLRSVCFERFPEVINGLLDDWQQTALHFFLNQHLFKKKAKLLDVGCGWGRMVKPLLTQYPGWTFIGIDPARSMVALYNQTVKEKGRAVVGLLPNLPFPKESFDCVLVITTLMYLLDQKERQAAVCEIDRLLIPGGVCIIIENNRLGHQIITGFGLSRLLAGNGAPAGTGGYMFDRSEIDNLFAQTSLSLQSKIGMPVITLVLPLLVIMAKVLPTSITALVGELVNSLDHALWRITFCSLYISYLYVKKQPAKI